MPLYAYKCTHCDHQFEVRQRFSEKPLTICPICEGEIRRVIGSVGVVFKGSGFYVTDNRNGKSNGLLNGASKKSETSNSDSDKSGETVSNVAAADKNKSDTASTSSSP